MIADTHFSVGKYLDPCCQKDMGEGQKEGGRRGDMRGTEGVGRQLECVHLPLE